MPFFAWLAMAALASASDQRFSMPVFLLLRLDAGIPRDLHPGLDFVHLVGPEGGGIARLDGEAELVDALHHLGLSETRQDLAREAVERRLRRRRRRKEA